MNSVAFHILFNLLLAGGLTLTCLAKLCWGGVTTLVVGLIMVTAGVIGLTFVENRPA